MRKVEDYKKHAEECRQLARTAAKEEHRQGLLKMAETWDGLAQERAAQIARQERISALENYHPPVG